MENYSAYITELRPPTIFIRNENNLFLRNDSYVKDTIDKL
jgi:hypothetical protein